MPNKATVLASISPHPRANVLLRAAANKAKELGVPWSVLYVETPDHYTLDSESRERALQLLSLAEEMGANVYHIQHTDTFDGLMDFIGSRYVKHLFIGQSSKKGIFGRLRSSTAERVVRSLRSTYVVVHAVPLIREEYKTSWLDQLQLHKVTTKEIGFALIMTLSAYIITEILCRFSGLACQVYSVATFFLIPITISSLRYGVITGITSLILSIAIIDYFYVIPLDSFTFSKTGDGGNLLLFIIPAAIICAVGAINRSINLVLVRKERRSQVLYKIHRLVTAATSRQQALTILYEELSELLEMEVAFFFPPAINSAAIELVYPQDVHFTETDKQSLITCWEKVRATGVGTASRFNSLWRFEPLSTPSNEIGVMGIKVPLHIRLDASFGRLVMALADQSASIFERIDLTQMMSETRISEEREKLRSMLLSSVSHDLKTPLASIMGAMSVYKRMRKSGRLDQEIADELINTTFDESQRLDSFISNILDITRIESGDITFDEEWVRASKLIESVQKRMRQRLEKHVLSVHALDGELDVLMDKMMTEQVLQNLIDNAVKYSPPNTEIVVSYGKHKDGFFCNIRDFGRGIPDNKFEVIFDKYERLKQSDRQVAGTGLGLAIAKAVMEKQKGSISVCNHPKGGAQFTLFFPKVRIPKNEGNKVGCSSKAIK